MGFVTVKGGVIYNDTGTKCMFLTIPVKSGHIVTEPK